MNEPLSPSTPTVTPEDWRREQRRRHVIQLLGVDPIISLRDAPGAAPAQRALAPTPIKVQFSAGQKTASPMTAAPTKEHHSSAQLRDLKAGFAGSGADSEPRSGRNTPTEANEPPSLTQRSAAPAVSFQLLLANAGGCLWVECLEDQLLRREQLQLVQAMARAVAGPEVALIHRQFDWPIANHPHLPKDIDAAKQSVAGQIQRLMQESECRGLVIMGMEAAPYLEAVSGLKHPPVSIPSTLSMLQDPMLKRDAWQVLKPLMSSI